MVIDVSCSNECFSQTHKQEHRHMLNIKQDKDELFCFFSFLNVFFGFNIKKNQQVEHKHKDNDQKKMEKFRE